MRDTAPAGVYPYSCHTSTRTRRAQLSLLKPIVRAYIFGHLSSTAPRLLATLLRVWSKSWTGKQLSRELHQLLSASLSIRKFPSFCALVTGAYTFLQIPLLHTIEHLPLILGKRRFSLGCASSLRWSRYIAAFLAAFLTFPLLNLPTPQREASCGDRGDVTQPPLTIDDPELAGKTLDLTLIAAVRALETLVHGAWTSACRSGITRLSPRRLELLSHLVDPFVFASSAGIVMWAWFYAPERLPPSYNRWITAAAQVDPRLVSALQHARRGEWVYGRDDGNGYILASMAADLSIPPHLGDPAKTIPVSCEIVHQGAGPSCHWSAAVRFVRAFRFALAMYLPLQLAVKTAHGTMGPRVLRATVREAIRSSTFLGAFISLFYYSVCLCRTVIGPRLFSRQMVSPQMWDSGYAVGAGCTVCGWTILIEAAKRRQELAFFVAPRAVAAILPRVYDRKYLWRERFAFALSIGVLFTEAHESPNNVRGMVGQALHGIISP